VEIEGMAQGARGALVGGENDPAARQRLLDLLGQRVGIVHTLFIRLKGLEKPGAKIAISSSSIVHQDATGRDFPGHQTECQV
jgi:hypothetical protein